MNVNLIDDSEPVDTNTRQYNGNNWDGRIKYVGENVWIFLQSLWLHKWSLIVAVIFFLNICAFIKLRNVSPIIPEEESTIKTVQGQIKLNEMSYAQIMQCAEIICKGQVCYCRIGDYMNWYSANDTCSRISPGYSSLAQGREAQNYIKSIQLNYKKTYWIGAYINQSRDCVWISGERFCKDARIVSIKRCLYAENGKLRFAGCASAYNAKYFPVCMRAKDGRNDSSCRQYKCSSDYCYCIMERSYHWKSGNKTCNTNFGFLTYFANKNEQDFVLSLAPHLKLMIGATLYVSSNQLHWFNTQNGITFNELNFDENQPAACYYTDTFEGKLIYTTNCDRSYSFFCQIKEIENAAKTYELADIQKAREKFHIKRCKYFFCISKFKKCYCQTSQYNYWGMCTSILGKDWMLTTLKSDKESKALLEIVGNKRSGLWLGYSDFLNKGKPRWIGGEGKKVNQSLTKAFKQPSCLHYCDKGDVCYTGCYYGYFSSLCSIELSKILV